MISPKRSKILEHSTLERDVKLSKEKLVKEQMRSMFQNGHTITVSDSWTILMCCLNQVFQI